MQGTRKSSSRPELTRRPGLESLEARLQLSTTQPFPTSGPLNGWLFKLVTTKGQDASGAEVRTFAGTSVQPGSINNRAQVSFSEAVNDSTGASAGEGLFVTRFSPRTTARFLAQTRPPISKVASTGDTVAGGTLGKTIGPSVINGAGRVAFAANLTTSAVPTKPGGVYVYLPGRKILNAVALPKDSLPDGSTFYGPNGPVSFNSAGQLAFSAYAKLSGPKGVGGATEGTGVFLASGLKQLSKVAAPGDVLSDRSTLDYAADPSVSETQAIAFVGHRVGDPVYTDPNDSTRLLGGSLFYVTPGNEVISIANQGQPLRSNQGGGTLTYAADPVANNRGQVLFHGALNGGSQFGVFQYNTGGLSRIAGPGDVLPDGSTLQTVITGPGTLGYSDRGDIAFVAQTNQGQGIYLVRGETVLLVAKTGDVIPALGLGAIKGFMQPDRTSGPIINNESQILFAAQTELGGTSLFSATALRTVTRRSGK